MRRIMRPVRAYSNATKPRGLFTQNPQPDPTVLQTAVTNRLYEIWIATPLAKCFINKRRIWRHQCWSTIKDAWNTRFNVAERCEIGFWLSEHAFWLAAH